MPASEQFRSRMLDKLHLLLMLMGISSPLGLSRNVSTDLLGVSCAANAIVDALDKRDRAWIGGDRTRDVFYKCSPPESERWKPTPFGE